MAFDRPPPTGPRGWQANNRGQQGRGAGRGRGQDGGQDGGQDRGQDGGQGEGQGRGQGSRGGRGNFRARGAHRMAPGPITSDGNLGHGHSGGTASRGRGMSGTPAGVPPYNPTGARGHLGPSTPAGGMGQNSADVPLPGRSATPVSDGAPKREVMKRPNPDSNPTAFYPPFGSYFDQADLPENMGDKSGHNICSHCLGPYGPGHTDSRTCDRPCGCCGTKDHQGGYCRQKYISWDFYSSKLGRLPYEDEEIKIRPTAKDVETMVKSGHKDFANLPSVTDSKKRKRETEDEAGLQDDESKAKKVQRTAESIEGYKYLVAAWRKKVKNVQKELRDLKAESEKQVDELREKDGELLELRTALEKIHEALSQARVGRTTPRNADERGEGMEVDETVVAIKEEEDSKDSKDSKDDGRTG